MVRSHAVSFSFNALVIRLAALLALVFVVLVLAVCRVRQAFPHGYELIYAANRTGQPDIFRMDIDRRLIHNLTRGNGDNFTPAWAPNGERIAFASNRSGSLQIFTARADGRDVRQLTDRPGGNTVPVWSPDGSRIAFISYRNGSGQIFVMNSDGSDVRPVTRGTAVNQPPVWSADGTQILFLVQVDTLQGSIQAVNTLDGTRRALTETQPFVTNIALSPDSREIAFISTLSGQINLYRMGTDNGRLRRLTQGTGIDQLPAWSPDGSHIAFVSSRSGQNGIYVLDATCDDTPDGCDGSLRQLVARQSGLPVWSPDGRYITYVATSHGSTELYMVDVDDGVPHRLTMNRAIEYTPMWRP